MHTVIIGAGGIGGYLAAKLSSAGAPVSVLARGAHLAAIRQSGLTLVEPDGEATVRLTATDDPATLKRADLLIVAVKTQDMPAALVAAESIAGAECAVLPFQNGVEAPAMVAQGLPDATPLVGVARILSNITAPGRITRYGGVESFVIGDAEGRQTSPVVGRVREHLRAAGVDVPQCADVHAELWTKFLLFNAVSATTACARTTMGPVRENPALWRLAQGLVAETAAVAAARGVALPAGIVEATVEVMRGMPPEARASMAHDLEQGKSLEADWICGAVARFGRQTGTPTPLSDACHGILQPWIGGRPQGAQASAPAGP